MLREKLEGAFELIRHHPQALQYTNICHCLAWLNLTQQPSQGQRSRSWETAYYLCEGQAVTFRHSAISNMYRKLR